MRYRIVLYVFLSLFFFSKQSYAQDGKAFFQQTCVACHTIGNGRLVGPDLKGVNQRHSQDWLLKFIKSPQTVINSGDKVADSLLKAHFNVVMPDNPGLSDSDIKSILAYIESFSGSETTSSISTTENEGDWQTGEKLFVGKIRFSQGGPSCNSCHNVNLDNFTSGGTLAKDLTQVVSRLSANGARAFYASNPMPMPQMQHSYQGKALTQEEVSDITAFLVYANDKANEKPVESTLSSKMLAGGVSGLVVLIVLFTIFWIKRKKYPVNRAIFNRQTL